MGRFEAALERVDPALIGLAFIAIALLVYVFSNGSRLGWYNHFVWQADAFLHGRFLIAFPVTEGPFQNGYFQDVMPIRSSPGDPSYGLLPFPPLPAIVLMPFVAVFGLATDSQLIGAAIGALNVGLAWRMTTRITDNRAAAFLATLFFAFGTVHWYAAMLSTTWFLAHVIAMTFVILGITLALDAEERERLRAVARRLRDDGSARASGAVASTFEERSLFLRWYRQLEPRVDALQFMAGFVFGLGALARLPVIFGAPFFVFVGGGGSYWKRGFSAALGAVIPVLVLLAYNIAATGHIFNPAYEWLYQTEYLGYMPPGLEIDRSLGIEDVRHIPLNLLIMFAWPPIILPTAAECVAMGFGQACLPVLPDQIGMSLLLTSPAYLLAVPIVLGGWRRRLILGAVLAVVAIAIVNLMHFSQGWVQFGYRFSNDFAPFALILVTLAIAWFWRHSRVALGLTVALVVASIAVNAWGVFAGVVGRW